MTKDELIAQHRSDGEALTKGPDLLAAARRAHTLLVNIELDAGEYYRETKWLESSIKAAEVTEGEIAKLKGLLRRADPLAGRP